jgi:hypothetical protein
MAILNPLKKIFRKRRPIAIKRSAKTYLKEQGWRLTYERGEQQLEGWYRCRYGSYAGKIQNLTSTKPSFFIKDPPMELKQNPYHGNCFTERPDMGKGWCSVHFSTLPRDLDSGVLNIEITLNESFVFAKKTA